RCGHRAGRRTPRPRGRADPAGSAGHLPGRGGTDALGRRPGRGRAVRLGADVSWWQLGALAAIAYAFKVLGLVGLGSAPLRGRAAQVVGLLPPALLAALV